MMCKYFIVRERETRWDDSQRESNVKLLQRVLTLTYQPVTLQSVANSSKSQFELSAVFS